MRHTLDMIRFRRILDALKVSYQGELNDAGYGIGSKVNPADDGLSGSIGFGIETGIFCKCVQVSAGENAFQFLNTT